MASSDAFPYSFPQRTMTRSTGRVDRSSESRRGSASTRISLAEWNARAVLQCPISQLARRFLKVRSNGWRLHRGVDCSPTDSTFTVPMWYLKIYQKVMHHQFVSDTLRVSFAVLCNNHHKLFAENSCIKCMTSQFLNTAMTRLRMPDLAKG